MRVVRSSVYRRYTSSLNDLQSNLNKSMNKVSTGAAYETAADNPLAYYQGKKRRRQ
jgi:flagellar hook-associated protein 3 FlgL